MNHAIEYTKPILLQKHKWLLGIFVFLAAAAAIYFILTQNFTSWDFRNNLWGPSHLLVTGRSPYLIEQLFSGSNSVWMPMVIGAFLPLGFMSEAHATNLWALVNVVLYFGVIVMSIPVTRPHLLWLGLILILLLVFPSFASVVIIGQFGIWATILMLAASRQVAPGRVLLAGLLVALASAKPQLIVLPVIGLLFAFYNRHGARTAARFLMGAAVWAFALTLPLWLGYPQWLEGFKIALDRNPAWMQPSAFVMLQEILPSIGLVLWALLALAALAMNHRVWHRLTPQYAMSWSLALNLLVTPYTWSWDFVLLVPLILQVLFRLRSLWLKAVLILGCGASIVMMIFVRYTTDNDEWRFWWFPWVMVGFLSVLALINRRLHEEPAQTIDLN